MKLNKNKLKVILVGLIVLYLIPLSYSFFSSELGFVVLILVFVIINPTYYLVSSILLTKLKGISWLTELIKVVLFIPTVFIYYNSSALGYVIPYSVINIIGVAIGQVLYIRDMK